MQMQYYNVYCIYINKKTIIIKLLLNYRKLDVSNLFAHQYEHGINNLNTYEIRQSLKYFFGCY